MIETYVVRVKTFLGCVVFAAAAMGCVAEPSGEPAAAPEEPAAVSVAEDDAVTTSSQCVCTDFECPGDPSAGTSWCKGDGTSPAAKRQQCNLHCDTTCVSVPVPCAR